MKLKEKEKRRKLLEKNNPDQAGKYTKAVAAEKLKQLTKAGRASILKVRMQDGKLQNGACVGKWMASGRWHPIYWGCDPDDAIHLPCERPWAHDYNNSPKYSALSEVGPGWSFSSNSLLP